MEYTGLQSVKNQFYPHLGGNIAEGDPFTFSPNAWNYVVNRFSVRSVLDLGSGIGYSSQYFHKLGLQVIAIDGMLENVEKAIYPTIQFDITKGPVHSKVDLVHCIEVVEHIEEKYLNHLLESLTCGKFILMTNSEPEQGGYHHVNEQETSYWTDHLARFNCHLLQEDTMRVRTIAEQEGASFLSRTGCLYANRNRI